MKKSILLVLALLVVSTLSVEPNPEHPPKLESFMTFLSH